MTINITYKHGHLAACVPNANLINITTQPLADRTCKRFLTVSTAERIESFPVEEIASFSVMDSDPTWIQDDKAMICPVCGFRTLNTNIYDGGSIDFKYCPHCGRPISHMIADTEPEEEETP